MRELNSTESNNVVGGLALFTWKEALIIGGYVSDFVRGFAKGVREQYRHAISE